MNIARWFLLFLCLPYALAMDFTLDQAHWLNRGQSASIKDISFTVYPTSGEPAERVVLRIDDDKLIIKFSECQEYKQRYKFCFTNTQFNPENDQGIVDYEKDVSYSQVRIEAYYLPDEALAGASVARTFSKSKPLVGETVEVEVTISNNNEESGIYGLSYAELVPTDAQVLILSDEWDEQTLTWNGNILAGDSITLSYTLKALVPKNITIVGRLRSDTISIDKTSVLEPKATGFVSINATGGAQSVVGIIQDTFFAVDNEIDEDVDVTLSLDVPHGLLYTGGSLQFDKAIGNIMRYSVKARIPEDENVAWNAKLRIDEQGTYDVRYKVEAFAGSQKEEFEGDMTYSIPYIPLSLQVEEVSDYFEAGKPVALTIILRNRDQTATFHDISIETKTLGKTIGLERAKLDGITPSSDVEIIHVNISFPEKKMYLYSLNVSYKKGNERLSIAKELQFFPEPNAPIEDIKKEEQISQDSVNTSVEIELEQAQSQEISSLPTIEQTSSFQAPSMSTIFMIVLGVVAGGSLAFFVFKKRPETP